MVSSKVVVLFLKFGFDWVSRKKVFLGVVFRIGGLSVLSVCSGERSFFILI